MFQKIFNVKEELSWYKGQVNDELEKIIGGATGQIPARMLTIYKQAWEKAEEQKNWAEYVYLLIKCGDSHIGHPDLDKKHTTEEDLDGLVKRWTEYYSMAAMFYAAARVIAEKHKCVESFAPELFQEKLELVAKHFIKQECQKTKGILVLDHTLYTNKLHEIREKLRGGIEKEDELIEKFLAYGPIFGYTGPGSIFTTEYTANEARIALKDRKLLPGLTEAFKDIVASMIRECLAVIGKPPCKYVIAGIGSMSRNEMGPFSDIELATIIEHSSPKKRAYFYKLMCLVELKIISIGETELPRKLGIELKNGFGIDVGGNTPTRKLELLGTVQELVKRQIPVNRGGDVITLNALRTVCLIDGDGELIDEYRTKLAVRLDERYPISKNSNITQSIREGRAIQLFQADVYDFEPVLGKQRDNEQFNIKKELYRLPNNLVNYLSLYYGVNAQSTMEKLSKLLEGKFITEEAYKHIADLLDFATHMRVKTHLYYGYEKEDVYHKRLLNDEKGLERPLIIYELNDEEQAQLELCYRVLIPIHHGIQGFIDKNEPKDFRDLTLYDDRLHTQAEIASKMCRYQESIALYEKALNLNPEDIDISLRLGEQKLVLYDQDNLKFFHDILKVATKKHGEEHESIARIYNSIALTLKNRGEYKEATEYFFKALTIVGKAGDSDLQSAVHYPIICNNIGAALHHQSQYQEALEYYTRALSIRERIYEPAHPYIAESYNNIGMVLHDQDKYDEAKDYLSKALAIREEIYGIEHPKVAQSYNNIASVLRCQGMYDEVMGYVLKALAIYEKIYGPEHPDVAMSYNNIGVMLSEQDKYEEAMSYHLKALVIYEKVYGSAHSSIGNSYNHISNLLNSQGKYTEAMEYALKALGTMEKVYGAEHSEVAESYSVIGAILQAQGKYTEAMEYTLKALAINEKTHGLNHHKVAISYNNLGAVLAAQGKHAEAMDYVLKALAVEEGIYSPDHPYVALAYYNLGTVLEAQGKNTEAIEYYLKSLAINEKVYGSEHKKIVNSCHSIGEVLYKQAKYEEALQYYDKALNIRIKLYGELHKETILGYNDVITTLYALGMTREALEIGSQILGKAIEGRPYESHGGGIAQLYFNIGGIFLKEGQYKAAMECHLKSLAIREKIYDQTHADIVASYSEIGNIAAVQNNYGEAVRYFGKALTIQEKIYGKDHPKIIQFYNSIGTCLYDHGRYEEALLYYKQAVNIGLGIQDEQYLPIVAISYNQIGLTLNRIGKYEEAMEYYLKALAIKEKIYKGKEDASLATTYNNIASMLYRQGKKEEAIEYFLKSLSIKEIVYGMKHPSVIAAYNNIASLLYEQGRQEEAKQYFLKALGISVADITKIAIVIEPPEKNTNKSLINPKNHSRDSDSISDDYSQVEENSKEQIRQDTVTDNSMPAPQASVPSNNVAIPTTKIQEVAQAIVIDEPQHIKKDEASTALGRGIVNSNQAEQIIIKGMPLGVFNQPPSYVQQVQPRTSSLEPGQDIEDESFGVANKHKGKGWCNDCCIVM